MNAKFFQLASSVDQIETNALADEYKVFSARFQCVLAALILPLGPTLSRFAFMSMQLSNP
jgi:hypothetical protein